MKYEELNAKQRRHIKSQCSSNMHFEWEEEKLIDIFLGALPRLHYTNNIDGIQSLIWDLEQLYRSYDAFETNADSFIKELREKVMKIQAVQSNWYGLNFYSLDQYIKMHRFCLISGEGGIGKSFFVMELEECLLFDNYSQIIDIVRGTVAAIKDDVF